jgi:hypothetical protein
MGAIDRRGSGRGSTNTEAWQRGRVKVTTVQRLLEQVRRCDVGGMVEVRCAGA